jgi:outer membrane protein assembly factor BamB
VEPFFRDSGRTRFLTERGSTIRSLAGAIAMLYMLAGCSSYEATELSANGEVPAPVLRYPWNQHGGDPQKSGRSAFTGSGLHESVSVSRVWDEAASPCGWDAVMTSVVVDGHGNLYFGTSGGHVVSLSPADRERWRFVLPDAYERDDCVAGDDDFYAPRSLFDLNIDKAPAISGSVLLVGTSGHENAHRLYALDLQSGARQWVVPLDGVLKSEIAVDEDGIAFFSTVDTLYAVDTGDGTFATYPEVVGFGAPALGLDGSVYVCSSSGALVALDAHLEEQWRHDLGVSDIGPCFPAVDPDNGNIYLPVPREAVLAAFNASGSPLWQVQTNWSESSPSIGWDGTIYLGAADLDRGGTNCDAVERSSDGLLYAINPDGTVKWTFEVPTYESTEDDSGSLCYDNSRAIDSKPLVDAGGIVYFGTDAHRFFALDRGGRVVWETGGGTEYDRAPVLSTDGVLYFAPAGGSSGGLYVAQVGSAVPAGEGD